MRWHAATPGGHGVRWKKEIARLIQAGAPLLAHEHFEPHPTVPLIRAAAADALMDVPELTLKQFIRLYAHDHAMTMAMLKRQYPSLPRIFKEAKRRSIKERALTSHVA